MEILGHLINGLVAALGFLLNAYILIIIVAALLSWVNPDPSNPIVRFLRAVTQPVFAWLRAKLPFLVVSGFDLSPLAAIAIIYFLQYGLLGALSAIAHRLGA